jgi:hypothetical protein
MRRHALNMLDRQVYSSCDRAVQAMPAVTEKARRMTALWLPSVRGPMPAPRRLGEALRQPYGS